MSDISINNQLFIKRMSKDKLDSVIFILEDNEGDAFFTQEILEDIGFPEKNIHITDSISSLREMSIGLKPDILLLDLFLKDSKGLDTYLTVQNLYPSLPILILSGITDREISLNTVKSGAQDFLIKGDYDEKTLLKTIIYAIERKKHIDQIAESKVKYEQLFHDNPLPMFIIRQSDSSFLMFNHAAELLFGYSNEEFQNMNCSDLFLSNDKLGKILKNLSVDEINESECKTKNGESLFIEIKGKTILLDQEDAFILYFNNITEKKLFEAEKLNLINETQTDERNRFSMELHDGLAQHLIALNFFLAQLNEEDTINRNIMQNCFEIVKLSLNQTRSLCYNLTPPELEFGLLSALKSMFERMDSLNNMNFNLVVEDLISDEDFIDTDIYNLYRIIQEFVNNSIKHSKAGNIDCHIKKQKNGIDFLLGDDGIGFDHEKIKAGLGLKNIDQRAKLLGIDFQLTSAAGEGTKISFLIK